MKSLKLLLLALLCLPVVGCVTTQKEANTVSASTEWRIKSLEESFLNFREQQRQAADEDQEALQRIESRLAAIEGELTALRGGSPAPAKGTVDAPAGETWVGDLKPEDDGWVEGGKSQPLVENDEEKPWAKLPEPPAAPEPPAVIPEPEVIDRAQAPKSAPAPQAAAPAPKPAPASVPASSAATPKALYEQGYARYNAGDYLGARTAFDDFLAKYPNDDLAANALYWKGETYYSEKDYAQAILTFKEVTGKFPKHDKAAAALLKIGMSYDRVGDRDNALFYLRALQQDFPNSSAAGIGRRELSRLGG
jgi:tol-pal system protein YbgF